MIAAVRRDVPGASELVAARCRAHDYERRRIGVPAMRRVVRGTGSDGRIARRLAPLTPVQRMRMASDGSLVPVIESP